MAHTPILRSDRVQAENRGERSLDLGQRLPSSLAEPAQETAAADGAHAPANRGASRVDARGRQDLGTELRGAAGAGKGHYDDQLVVAAAQQLIDGDNDRRAV